MFANLLVLTLGGICAGHRQVPFLHDPISVKEADDASSALEAESEADTQRACDDKLIRLKKLHDQDLLQDVGYDPYFPPEMASIGPVNANCDGAAGSGTKKCSDYNHWRTFQQVARDAGKRFTVFGTGLAKASDIKQGELGNCYFLSALASIIFSGHKEVIENMFQDSPLWKLNVYKTRWLLGGTESIIAVDNTLPADERDTFFGGMGDAGEFWPIILEKAWAKIFGSYKNAEGGQWGEVVAAITRAPVVRTMHTEDPDTVWNNLVTVTSQGFPTGAGSSSTADKYGLVTDHQYSVLEVAEDRYMGNIVRLYNPWRTVGYKGAIKNKKSKDGTFWMTFSEYIDAFDLTQHASVRANHQAQYLVELPIFSTPLKGAQAMELTTDTASPFVVSITWPSVRMVRPCELPEPNVSLALARVAPNGKAGQPRLGKIVSNSEVLDVPDARPGKYLIYAFAHFQGAEYLSSVHLSVYGGQEANIGLRKTTITTPNVGLQMFGPVEQNGLPCETVTFRDQGVFFLDRERTVGGMPTYRSLGDGGKDFVYSTIWETTWRYTLSEHYEAASQRLTGWSFKGYDKIGKDEFSCACRDSTKVEGWNIPCSELYGNDGKAVNNVNCEDAEAGPDVRRYCPVLCGLGEGNCPTTTTTTTTEPLPTGADGQLCKYITAGDQGLFTLNTNKKALGRATYWSYDNKEFIYFYEDGPEFLLARNEHWKALVAATPAFNFHKSLQQADLKCGCQDTRGDIKGFGGVKCQDATDDRPKYSNVHCTGAEYSRLVQRFCPLTCGLEVC